MQPFYVEVEGPNHSRILQEIAFDEGYEWFNGQKIQFPDEKYLHFGYDGNIVWSQYQFVRNISKILKNPTLEEFRQALRGEYNWEELIEIGGYEVEFEDGYIVIGCEKYDYDQIRNIYIRSSNAQKVNRTYAKLRFSLEHSEVGEIPFEKVESIFNRIQN